MVEKSPFGRRKNKFLCLVVLLLLVALGFGCGASRQEVKGGDESIDIDDLLGEDKMASSNRDSDEEEVLQLLGITPAEQTKDSSVTTTPQAAPMSTASAEISNSENELDQLRGDLIEKDQEISDLRSQLTQSEMKISDLESKMKSQQPRQPVNTRTAGASGASYEFKVKYQDALALFKARNYQGALTAFSELMKSDPLNSLSDNCQYWIGECYYAILNYNQAIAEFEKVFSFANSNKNDDAQLKLGLCYMRLGDKAQARAEFDRLLSVYPDSEYRSAAQKYIGRL